RGHLRVAQGLRRLKDQAIPSVLDVGDYAVLSRRQRILVGFIFELLVACPVSSLEIKNEAELVPHPPPSPAEIDSPNRRGLAVNEMKQGFSLHLRARPAAGDLMLVSGKAHGCPELVP